MSSEKQRLPGDEPVCAVGLYSSVPQGGGEVDKSGFESGFTNVCCVNTGRRFYPLGLWFSTQQTEGKDRYNRYLVDT